MKITTESFDQIAGSFNPRIIKEVKVVLGKPFVNIYVNSIDTYYLMGTIKNFKKILKSLEKIDKRISIVKKNLYYVRKSGVERIMHE